MADIKILLKEVIFDIMEEMFFLFPDDIEYNPTGREVWIPKGIKIVKKQDYDNEEKDFAELGFLFSHGLARKMTNNFTGENEIDTNLINGTIDEAVNIVAGNLVNRVGDNSLFISTPYNIDAFGIESDSEILSFENDPLVIRFRSLYGK